MSNSITRRQFLKAGLVLGAGAHSGESNAIGKKTQVRLAQLKIGSGWSVRQSAVTKLAQEVSYRTSIQIAQDPVALAPSDPKLFYHPLLILTGDRALSGLVSHQERQALRKYMQLGGFLWVDAAVRGSNSQGFDASLRKLVSQLFPGRKLERLPADHVIFRSFFRVSYPAGRVMHQQFVEGVRLDRRVCLLYTVNDVLGALEQDAFGNWKHDVSPGGLAQRRLALKLGINIIEYALCLNYKSDQVHLDYLLRKRQWYIRRQNP